MIPTRIELRRWLATLDQSEIVEKLTAIKKEHGDQIYEDMRLFLNTDRKAFNSDSPAEETLFYQQQELT